MLLYLLLLLSRLNASAHFLIILFTEQLYLTQSEEREKQKDTIESANQIKDALETQMESHRELHQRQLAELRQEISEKQSRIDQLTESVVCFSATLSPN